MFHFQVKEKIRSSSEELSSATAQQNRPFAGGVSNSGLIQLLSGSASNAPEAPDPHSFQNTSSIPAGLKAKYEQRSGISMNDVSVHYNSDKPVQYGALAYTQGNDVYLGSGQEKHLGHELGHVIQQKQGRVPITGSVGGAPLNDDPALEQEADSFLSGNSLVQHITAGYHPDSGAPIQRLRINLAGDNKDSKYPEVRQAALFQIATGGERLDVPDGDHDKVKETVVACQKLLAIDEDIVFEGHGNPSKYDKTTIASLQHFSPKELAQMAADIKKSDDWQGKILLFGCSAGDIASQVAKEYYEITGKSVTVVGPKERITVLPNPLDCRQAVFGFTDSKMENDLKSNRHHQLLVEIRNKSKLLWKEFDTIYCRLTDSLMKSYWEIQNTPAEKRLKTSDLSMKIDSEKATIWNFKKNRFIPTREEINNIIDKPPAGFWNRYPSLGHHLKMFYAELNSLIQQSIILTQSLSMGNTDRQKIDSLLLSMSKICKQIQMFYGQITCPYILDIATTFKSYLDFNDTEMMISATYLPQESDIEQEEDITPPAPKRSPKSSDDT